MEDPRSIIYDLMINDVYTSTDIAIMCLRYMSDEDVLQMIQDKNLTEAV